MAEANPNSMSGAHEPRVATFSDQLDAICRSLDALHYLDNLLDLAVNADGGGLADQRSGLSALMGRQLEDIGDAVEALRVAWTETTARLPEMTAEERIVEIVRRAALADAGRPAWHDIETIAARARVHQDEAARVMFVLTGEDHYGLAYRAWDGNLHEGLPAHLLASHIWKTLSHGDVWGQVSAATGLELDRLKVVLEAMLQYLPRREAIELQGLGAES